MLTNNFVRLVKSLKTKKGRIRSGCFLAEGPKVIKDMMNRYEVETLVATKAWIEANGRQFINPDTEVVTVKQVELEKLSFLQTPQDVMAIMRIPNWVYGLDPTAAGKGDIDYGYLGQRLSLVLDGVQDPGNMGTIIRIADWYGISNIFCSSDTADIYNPKVVQAAMGSLGRVDVSYTDVVALVDQSERKGIPVFVTVLDGENIYESNLSGVGLIVMGNEGNGISQSIRDTASRKLLIPNFHEGEHAESLNVAVATAIVCSEFKRRI